MDRPQVGTQDRLAISMPRIRATLSERMAGFSRTGLVPTSTSSRTGPVPLPQTRRQTRRVLTETRIRSETRPSQDIQQQNRPRESSVQSTMSSPSNAVLLPCAICFEEMYQSRALCFQCGHVYCNTCVQTIIFNNLRCPKCRRLIQDDNVWTINF